MLQAEVIPSDLRVLSEQIYQYKKGVRKMVLYTFPERYRQQALDKLERQGIDYFKECMDTIRKFIHQPLNELTPEEDFILGTLLGYDICSQCERYCKRKS